MEPTEERNLLLREIKARLALGIPKAEIARQLKISRMQVWRILNRK